MATSEDIGKQNKYREMNQEVTDTNRPEKVTRAEWFASIMEASVSIPQLIREK